MGGVNSIQGPGFKWTTFTRWFIGPRPLEAGSRAIYQGVKNTVTSRCDPALRGFCKCFYARSWKAGKLEAKPFLHFF